MMDDESPIRDLKGVKRAISFKSREVLELSPDRDALVCCCVVSKPDLTGEATELFVKNGNEVCSVEPFFVSGSRDIVRAHLHSLIDGFFDVQEEAVPHPDDEGDRPVVWRPGA